MKHTETNKHLTQADKDKMQKMFDTFVNSPESFDDEDIRTAIIIKIDDISGSMQAHEKTMYEANTLVLQELAGRNENATEVRHVVQQIFLNNNVTVFNEELMDPADLLTLLSEKDFKCYSTTNMDGMLKHIDDAFHTDSPLVAKMVLCGIKPVILFTTDWCGNHDTAKEKEYIKKIKNNRLIQKYVQMLCVYVGPESRKQEVEDLFGVDNVVPLTKDLSKHLANTLINSTINLLDGTRINAQEQTAREVAEKEKANSESTATALGTMSYDEAKQYMNNLFGRTG